MNVRSTEFRVQEGQKVDLHKWPTAVEPIYESKKQYQKLLKKHVDELSSLQQNIGERLLKQVGHGEFRPLNRQRRVRQFPAGTRPDVSDDRASTHCRD